MDGKSEINRKPYTECMIKKERERESRRERNCYILLSILYLLSYIYVYICIHINFNHIYYITVLYVDFVSSFINF